MILTAAWLSSVRSIDCTEPMRRPPTWTSLPGTSWPAFSNSSVYSVPPPPRTTQPRGERDDQGECQEGGGAGDRHSIPSGPWDAPARNWRTNGLSESNSSSAGPDSTIRPFHSTAMYSATRLADMMSWVMTT